MITSNYFNDHNNCCQQFTGDGSKEKHTLYTIAIPANRYDLLCIEGFARALRIFLNLETPPVSKICLDDVATEIDNVHRFTSLPNQLSD